jgi:hypothetical protein
MTYNIAKDHLDLGLNNGGGMFCILQMSSALGKRIFIFLPVNANLTPLISLYLVYIIINNLILSFVAHLGDQKNG